MSWKAKIYSEVKISSICMDNTIYLKICKLQRKTIRKESC